MEAEYKARLDQLQEQKTLSYDRFEEHGKAFIDVMEDGISELEDEVWVSADEVQAQFSGRIRQQDIHQHL